MIEGGAKIINDLLSINNSTDDDDDDDQKLIDSNYYYCSCVSWL